MSKIVLTTLNSRYSHTSIALRYLYANLKDLKDNAKILEFVINENIQNIAETILNEKPQIVGIGVYIWNAIDVSELIKTIKLIEPKVIIILGGPEVSHLPHRVEFKEADYFVKGEGEIAFYNLCTKLLNNQQIDEKFIKEDIDDVKNLSLPYKYYDENDIKNRKVYVESSRGCPFSCEFCISSLDKYVRYFDVEIFITELENLWQRGARDFKFIDRTFNLNIDLAIKIMDFFLKKTEQYSLHFEVIPDRFPDIIKEKIASFPKASLQLEIGIQTLNINTAENISRKFNFEKIKSNISFLENNTNAHMHLDLIVGLPGENLKIFADNLNQLLSITKSEIQIGILKKLSGTTINRHDLEYKMVYSNTPPYDILKNSLITFQEIQIMKRFSRFWDLYYNSGNFIKCVDLLLGKNNQFQRFYDFTNWIYKNTLSTWQFSLNRLAELIYEYLKIQNLDNNIIEESLIYDITKIKGREVPTFLRDLNKNIEQKDNNKNKQIKRQLQRVEL